MSGSPQLLDEIAEAAREAGAAIADADEALGLLIRRPLPAGREMLPRQIYARQESHVGVLTFTTVAAEEPRMRPEFEKLARECRFQPARDEARRD